jgi:sugar/nucleoside kinase (ribokinase family)
MADAPSLICIGNLTIDEAVSPAGERVESVGGDALFAALAARLVGGNPSIVAPLGNDATPALLAAIRSAGTDPAALPRRDLPTVRNVVRYDDAGGRVWDLVLGDAHFEELSVHPADISDGALAAAGVLVSAMALQAQLELAAWLRAHAAATIYFDPQEDYIAGHEAALLDAVRACDVFLPSEIEAVTLAGTSELHGAAAAFLELGPRVVVIKLAAAGCLVTTRERPKPTVVATDVVEPVDSTGAGDAFSGAFAAEHLLSGDAYAAAEAGAAAARIAVGGPGVSGLLAAIAREVVR